MTATILCRWALALILMAAIAGSVAAQAIDTRCMENGGSALCTEPVLVPAASTAAVDAQMWTYNACDMDGPFAWRSNVWCQVRGGCTGPIFEGTLVAVSTEFERIVNGACEVNVVDSGWGQTLPGNILCWAGPPLAQNEALIRDFRILNFSGTAHGASGCNSLWTDTVFAGRWRKLACPPSFNARSRPNGDLECWKLVPECPARVGNPINLLDGCKVQREVDYQPLTPGAIEVVRYYTSAGSVRFAAAPEAATDYWRTTWDRRVLVPRGASTVLAYAQRADGSLHVFMANGRELLNAQGGGSALIERLTDTAGALAGWRLTTADSDVELYDAAGRLQSATLRAGWAYTLAYGADGRLATVTDARGAVVTFTYDAVGRPSGFVAPGNRACIYGYDGKGRLISVTYPDNAVRTYHYEDANFLHALTGITDENGARFATWTYDSIGRATSSAHAAGAEAVTLYPGAYSPTSNEGRTIVVDAFGTTRTYSYQAAAGLLRINRVTRSCTGCVGASAIYAFDPNGNVSSYTDFNGNRTTYTFDLARNLELARADAAGTALARTTTTQWHPVFRLPTRITAPSSVSGVSEVTDLDYDGQGNLVQKRVTSGTSARRWTMTYNARGQVLRVDGPRTDAVDVTAYTYYPMTAACVGCRGNVSSTTNAVGHVTTFDDYDLDGRPVRITDPNGVVTTSVYDLRGRLRTRTVDAGSPAAETTKFDYDKAGQLIKVTKPDGAFLRYQYDDAHRLTEVTDGEYNVHQYTLDAMGNRIREDVFDPADRPVKARQRSYDALNRLYSEIGAAGQASTFQYDGNGNLVRSADPLARITTFGYDALNRLLTSTDPVGGITRYGYDAMDRLVSVRDPIGLTTTYTYDGLGNLTRLASPDTGISTFVMDVTGNVVGATDARGVAASYAYDALNRQTLATYGDGNVALEYDNTGTGGSYARGRLTGIADSSGTTRYTYDALGRVLRKSQTIGADASMRTFSVSYRHAAGRTTGLTYPSGRSLGYGFDAQGRITDITMDGRTILSGIGYFPFGGVQAWTWANGQSYRRSFDADGRIAALTLGPDALTYGSETWTFGYDGLNRLTSAVLPPGEALAYLYDANGNRKQETRAGATTNYTYVAGSNRLQSLAGAVAKDFAYDATGNLTSNGSVTFTFDGRGRLTQSSSGHSYAINGLGQRVAKSGPGVVTGTNYFVYDESGHLIGEYDTAGSVRQELVYLADTPVASVRPNASGGTDIFPIYSDHLDTPRLITNQTNQKVWEWKTDTFGAGVANENPSDLGVFPFNLRFPGQYYDAETELHYNYFRDYDPTIGRYVERDPIGLKGGMNPFVYVSSSPATWSDFFGLNGEGSGFSTRYGNWCGKNWSGGNKGPLIPQNPLGPIDSVDECCMTHDYCYARYECATCSAGSAANEGKRVCDLGLLNCLDALKGKPPQMWPKPPSRDNEANAYFFCQKAKMYFR